MGFKNGLIKIVENCQFNKYHFTYQSKLVDSCNNNVILKPLVCFIGYTLAILIYQQIKINHDQIKKRYIFTLNQYRDYRVM